MAHELSVDDRSLKRANLRIQYRRHCSTQRISRIRVGAGAASPMGVVILRDRGREPFGQRP